MPTYIQLVYLRHVKMQLVNGEFQVVDVVLRLISMVVHVISFKSNV